MCIYLFIYKIKFRLRIDLAYSANKRKGIACEYIYGTESIHSKQKHLLQVKPHKFTKNRRIDLGNPIAAALTAGVLIFPVIQEFDDQRKYG